MAIFFKIAPIAHFLQIIKAERVLLRENGHFLQDRPHRLLCVDEIESPPRSHLCVDKFKSRPSRGYRIASESRAEQLSQNLVRPEDLG